MKNRERDETRDQFLSWNPLNFMFRVLKAHLHKIRDLCVST